MGNNLVELSEQELEKLADIIQKESGIFLDNVKLKRFKRRIQILLTKTGFKDFTAFYHQIRFAGNRALMEKLINTVSINETYFWRESNQFKILTSDILPKYINRDTPQKIRILVAPSSSGEEIYSIMLAILDAGDLIDKLLIDSPFRY